MLRNMATDPSAFFRTMLGEWKKLANSVGGDMLKTDEWSRAMNAGCSQARGARSWKKNGRSSVGAVVSMACASPAAARSATRRVAPMAARMGSPGGDSGARTVVSL